MPLVSRKEVLRLKLSTLPVPILREISKRFTVVISNKAEMITSLLNTNIDEDYIESIIKREYRKITEARNNLISDGELLEELNKVKAYHWGVIQGQLDDKIQRSYVRQFPRFDELIHNVENTLYSEIKSYVICTWYNHWTTILIEDLISSHPKIIPTITNVKGVDIFFDEQPFDLKVTYLPRGLEYETVISNPQKLIVWMYENQGSQRFGEENRFFVIVHDKKNPDRSWEIKRNIPLIKEHIAIFLDKANVTINDEIAFTFNKASYTAISKILFITN